MEEKMFTEDRMPITKEFLIKMDFIVKIITILLQIYQKLMGFGVGLQQNPIYKK